MPKYKIIHSLLQTPKRDFMQDEIVTTRELHDAGTDLAFLLQHGTIAVLEGTEDDAEESAPDPSEADALRAELAELRARLAAGVNAQPSVETGAGATTQTPPSAQRPATTPANRNQGASTPETGLTQNPGANTSANTSNASDANKPAQN